MFPKGHTGRGDSLTATVVVSPSTRGFMWGRRELSALHAFTGSFFHLFIHCHHLSEGVNVREDVVSKSLSMNSFSRNVKTSSPAYSNISYFAFSCDLGLKLLLRSHAVTFLGGAL
ncbi:hypothetical protein SUGI_1123520 [Cryptomeria japonica]|nr:hypothetical protein SUGI_1123520 [Cryptomeria japonica]